MHKQRTIFVMRIITILLMSFLVFLLPVSNAEAANGLSIYTTFPSTSAIPGEDIKADIKLSNTTGQGMTVDLEIESAPEGWEVYIEGDGRIIDKVYVGEEEAEIRLTVKIPRDVKEGRYQVVLSGTSGEISDQLVMEFDIKYDIDNQGTLTANYKELTGSSDTNFTFDVDIKNNKNETQTYSLVAQAESGWQVNFSTKADRKQVSSIPVDANQTAGLLVEIIPPSNVTAGEYIIPIAASSKDETLMEEFKVVITGTYGMEVTTSSGRLNAETVAGRRQLVELIINNTGTSELKAVKLVSEHPDGWNIEFDQDIIDSIAPGESATVKTYIQPDDKALAGDYMVKISAETPETVNSAEIRVMVKTSTLWGIVAILIIILLVLGLYWVFEKYGRR